MFKKILLLSFLIGCSAQYLNLTHKHHFRVQPQEIVWLQLGELRYETLELIKNKTLVQENKFYNQFTCVGTLWTQSSVGRDLQSLVQLSGNRYQDKLCPALKVDYIWDYFKDEKYEVTLIDMSGSSNESFLALKKCGETFENIKTYEVSKIESLSAQVAQNKKTKKLTIIRDLNVQNFAQWEKKIGEIVNWQSQKKTRLFVISSLAFKSDQSLMTPLFATGASAENFCGIVAPHELLERFITGMKYSLF